MVTAPFDQLAAGYDSVAESALGVALRYRVWSVVSRYLTGADLSVAVDLGCGTGIDTAWLSERIETVWGFDASAAMVEQASTRLDGATGVQLNVADLADLDIASAVGEPAGVILANFGVVNCVGDLGDFGRRVDAALAPGGVAIVVTMPRWCPIEIGIGIATANRSLLRRRRGVMPDSTVGPYGELEVRYASSRTLADAFAPGLQLVASESLGLVLPPFEQRSWVEHRPELMRRLKLLDRRLGPLGARAGLGDHHIAVFAKAPAS